MSYSENIKIFVEKKNSIDPVVTVISMGNKKAVSFRIRLS